MTDEEVLAEMQPEELLFEISEAVDQARQETAMMSGDDPRRLRVELAASRARAALAELLTRPGFAARDPWVRPGRASRVLRHSGVKTTAARLRELAQSGWIGFRHLKETGSDILVSLASLRRLGREYLEPPIRENNK